MDPSTQATTQEMVRTARLLTMMLFVATQSTRNATARAENRRKGRLSALRAHTKAPHKTDLLKKTLRNAKAA